MLELIAHATFMFFNSLRVVSYLPTIARVYRDTGGASGISYWTWGLWVCANLSLALHAAVNLGDLAVTALSLINSICCLIVISLTITSRRAARRNRNVPARSDQPIRSN